MSTPGSRPASPPASPARAADADGLALAASGISKPVHLGQAGSEVISERSAKAMAMAGAGSASAESRKQAEAPSELSRARRLLVLGICSMSLLIVGLDMMIVNVALPAIHRELRASVSGLQWTIDADTLVIASLLMLAGSTADRVGRRRTFRAGLAVFSGMCPLARAASSTASMRPRSLDAVSAFDCHIGFNTARMSAVPTVSTGFSRSGAA